MTLGNALILVKLSEPKKEISYKFARWQEADRGQYVCFIMEKWEGNVTDEGACKEFDLPPVVADNKDALRERVEQEIRKLEPGPLQFFHGERRELFQRVNPGLTQVLTGLSSQMGQQVEVISGHESPFRQLQAETFPVRHRGGAEPIWYSMSNDLTRRAVGC